MNTIAILIAKYFFILPILIGAVFFLRQSTLLKKRMVICGLVIAPLSYIFAKIAGFLYYNPRPFVIGHFVPLVAHAASNGFPSDHVLLTAAIAMIIWFYDKKLSAVLWVLALLIGWARVYSGIHHTADIVGSIVIVLISGAIYYLFVQKKQKRVR